MHISEFDYELPLELIAKTPAEPRDASRMMVLERATRRIIDSRFLEFPNYLRSSDVLVLNNTRVIRARMYGRLARRSGGSRPVEVFFAEPIHDDLWRVLCRPGRRIRPGDRVVFGENAAEGEFQESETSDMHTIRMISREPVHILLERHGHVPLPPYIDRPDAPADESHYQTVFAERPGAVAAPTAGLHFTEPVLTDIRNRGIEILYITLHVGIGTFLPVRTEHPEEHALHSERFEVDARTAERLNAALRERRRVVAVGTTTTRTLEHLMQQYDEIRPGAGRADLYILPGFKFKIVGTLLTNFHLPRSTLLMLACAFAGRDAVLAAYRHAIAQRYRFYSYGDCMLLTTNG